MPATAFVDAHGVAVPFAELEQSYSAERWQMPLPLLKSLARQKRGYCDISVTELVGPPQVRVLRSRHEYALDPFDQVWAGFGTGLHKMLELKAEASAMTEKRLLAEFEVPTSDGSRRRVRLGGTVDHYSDEAGGTLTNYKCTTTYKAKKLHDDGPAALPEWVAAENCYAYLWRLHGFAICKLRVCLLLKDWSMREREDAANKYLCSKCGKNHMRDSKPGKEHGAFEDKSQVIWYPPTPIFMLDLPLWAREETNRYILERLELHVNADLCPDDKLAGCTEVETWNGRRCEHWCEVAHLCHQQRRSIAQPVLEKEDSK
jgi:hypothetical protein